jgi:hypothetical protein
VSHPGPQHNKRMTEITPKRTIEAWRNHVVRTSSWDNITDYYKEQVRGGARLEPMLRLVEAIAGSPAAAELYGTTSTDDLLMSELFGATSTHDLLLSDCPDFRAGDSTLRIAYHPGEHGFVFHHHCFSGHDDHKNCDEAEGGATFSAFLKYKYGVLFEMPTMA